MNTVMFSAVITTSISDKLKNAKDWKVSPVSTRLWSSQSGK